MYSDWNCGTPTDCDRMPTSQDVLQFACELLGRPIPQVPTLQTESHSQAELLEWIATVRGDAHSRWQQADELSRATGSRTEIVEYLNDLLEKDWDASKHPRGGFPQNRGWFSPADGQGGNELSKPIANPLQRQVVIVPKAWMPPVGHH